MLILNKWKWFSLLKDSWQSLLFQGKIEGNWLLDAVNRRNRFARREKHGSQSLFKLANPYCNQWYSQAPNKEYTVQVTILSRTQDMKTASHRCLGGGGGEQSSYHTRKWISKPEISSYHFGMCPHSVRVFLFRQDHTMHFEYYIPKNDILIQANFLIVQSQTSRFTSLAPPSYFDG